MKAKDACHNFYIHPFNGFNAKKKRTGPVTEGYLRIINQMGAAGI